jgi:hypothetical protein
VASLTPAGQQVCGELGIHSDQVPPDGRRCFVEKFKLPRSGTSPVEFEGTLLREAAPPVEFQERQRQWFELRLFKTAAGRHVLAIHYESKWPTERPIDEVVVFAPGAGPEQIKQRLDELEIGDFVIGYPTGSMNHRTKQQRLLRLMDDHLDEMIAKLLDLPDFTERIE